MKKRVKELISNGQIREVFQLLLANKDLLNDAIEHQVTLISSWYNRVVQKERNGIGVSQDEFQKIIKALLETVDQLHDDNTFKIDFEEKTIFERNISIKLLPIPFLENKINTFKIPLESAHSVKKLTLFLPNRKINLEFDCPDNITVKQLKKSILNHFDLESFIEYNSIIKKLLKFKKIAI